VELLLAAGLGCTYIGLVSAIVLEGLEAGALATAATAATFSGFIHFIRIFGGQTGVALMTHFISVREKFHSNLLGLHLQSGSWLTAYSGAWRSPFRGDGDRDSEVMPIGIPS